MILLTGDTHGEVTSFLQRLLPYAPKRSDTVIVCGDFGFVWNSTRQRSRLKQLSELPFTVAFVDGNHEDFDLLGTYPVEYWKGGSVHRIAENVLHLMRGQCYVIEGNRYFVMGGAGSSDRVLRREHVSWWREELPSRAEYETAVQTLQANGFLVDYILTHTLPGSAVSMLGIRPDPYEAQLSDFLELVYRRVQFRMWFAGHFHINCRLCSDLTVLYDDVSVIGGARSPSNNPVKHSLLQL